MPDPNQARHPSGQYLPPDQVTKHYPTKKQAQDHLDAATSIDREALEPQQAVDLRMAVRELKSFVETGSTSTPESVRRAMRTIDDLS